METIKHDLACQSALFIRLSGDLLESDLRYSLAFVGDGDEERAFTSKIAKTSQIRRRGLIGVISAVRGRGAHSDGC